MPDFISAITLSIRYTGADGAALDARTERDLLRQIEWIPTHITGEGLLTGDTAAEVELSVAFTLLAPMPALPPAVAPLLAATTGG